MKYLAFFLAFVFLVPEGAFASIAEDVSGRIVLDVEQNGEAWYVNPLDLRRTYLGRPDDAFMVMRSFGLGISNADLAQFDVDAGLRARLSGRILLAVESHGEAYYVHPVTRERHYLGRSDDAFHVMRTLGLGISSRDLALIGVAGVEEQGVAGSIYLSGVPFTTQAPFGDWSDLRQEEACEEASVLMAIHWARFDATLTPSEALSEILAITNWETATFGYHHDTGAADTAQRLFKQWFGYDKVSVQGDINTSDIVRELQAGHLVLVPIQGSLIGNPYYAGTVERHMIVINGYDAASDEFIAHDPGTRYGNDIRFTRTNVDRALRDYTSGIYAPIGEERTAMIVVSR